MCKAERWDKSRNTERVYRPDARERRAERLDDEAPRAIYDKQSGIQTRCDPDVRQLETLLWRRGDHGERWDSRRLMDGIQQRVPTPRSA